MGKQPKDCDEDNDIGPTFPAGSHAEAVERARLENLKRRVGSASQSEQMPHNNAQD
jgi:hypothetical protein